MPGYRRLRREQLIAEIEARGNADAEEEPEAAAEDIEELEPDEPYEEDEAEVGGPEPEPDEVVVEGALVDDEVEEPIEVDAGGVRDSDADTEEVAGVLELMPQRFGFLRLHGLEPSDDDVYISASQVRRCELRSGDEVTGPAREPRRGERHRALVHVDLVNGEEPLEADRPDFDALPPVAAGAARHAAAPTSSPGRSTCWPRWRSASGCWCGARRARDARHCFAASPTWPSAPTRADRPAGRRAPRGGDRLARAPLGHRCGARDRDRRHAAARSGSASPSWRSSARRRRAETGADACCSSTRSRGWRTRPAASAPSSTCSAPGATSPAAGR